MFIGPAQPHLNTNTHRTRYVITHKHDIRIYSGNIIKNTLHTRELKNHRTPQQPIFTETRLLKQPHTSQLITNHSPLNKDTNAKTSILTEQYNTWNKSTIIRKLLKMDVLTCETCWAVNGEIMKQVTSNWSIFIQHILCWITFNPPRKLCFFWDSVDKYSRDRQATGDIVAYANCMMVI